MVGVPKRVKACEACRKRRLTVGHPRGRLYEQQLTSSSAIMAVQRATDARQTIGTADTLTLSRLL
jgi:hypothetical protein